MISETMFSNFTNVSEEKHKSIKINNFENIPKQMGKLNAPKIQNNNNLYGNIPKKNYNGMYPYIKYESDILKKSYIPKKLDFSKNIINQVIILKIKFHICLIIYHRKNIYRNN
jgi:hypothetical protein